MNILLLFIFGCACATALPQEYTSLDDEEFEGRIVEGNNAKRRRFRYMVSVQLEGKHLCGASIISQTWLVSAAHCYYDELRNTAKNSQFVAVAGLLRLSENHQDIQTIPIEEIIIHPEYDNQYYRNDIALLKLKLPLKFSKAVKRINLPQPNTDYVGKVVVAGWGYTSQDPPIEANRLQYLEMDLINNKECNQILATAPDSNTTYPFLVRNTKLCALPYEVSESACHGDGGGPLVQNNVLVGIVHGGDRACTTKLDTHYPSIFTRVSAFIDFINEYVKDLPQEAC